MLRLREEVKGLKPAEGVAIGFKCLQIPYLGRWIAGDVDNALGIEEEELLKKILPAAFAGRINDNGGQVCRKCDLFKDPLSRGSNDFDIREAVVKGVLPGPVSRGFGNFHPDNGFEMSGQGESEKPGSSVGIHEKTITR